MSGSARAGTISREAYLRAVNPEALQCALSRARPGHLCFSVDKDLHGCRLFGQNLSIFEFCPVCLNVSLEEHEVLQKAELSCEADSENDLGGSSETICITSDWMCTRRRSAIA
jgi:hypothetical protein